MGLVVRPGSIESGDVPRFIIFRGKFVSELSIFIDESGDFGPYDYRSPYYIITMVFHDQSVDISTLITKLESDLSNRGFPNHCVHTGPIIRRENEYELNKTYAFDTVSFSEWLTELRKVVLEDTVAKLEQEGQ